MPNRRIVTDTPLTNEQLERLGRSITIEDYREFVEEVRATIKAADDNLWKKADLAQEAAQKYGKLRELCDELGQSYGYWRILSHVSRQFSVKEREKYPNLSFGHFQAVVSHKNRHQILKRANDEGWSVNYILTNKWGKKEEKPKPEPRVPTEAELLEKEIQAQPVIKLDKTKPEGRVIEEAAALLNFIYLMDKNVGSSVGTSVRPCEDRLSNWIGEQLEVPPHGVGVLDIFNLLFLDHGVIEYRTERDEPFVACAHLEKNDMEVLVVDEIADKEE